MSSQAGRCEPWHRQSYAALVGSFRVRRKGDDKVIECEGDGSREKTTAHHHCDLTGGIVRRCRGSGGGLLRHTRRFQRAYVFTGGGCRHERTKSIGERQWDTTAFLWLIILLIRQKS